MVDSKMIIPKTITVGYNKRDDTYTGKLAYVIYTDDKGKLRKEASWQNWRDKKLGQDNFDNVPTSGFVLNKGVGGARMSYGWNARNEYVRVYDPRNFEFEISVSNLLFILQECSAIKGKGLEGEFVYSWSGTELVLLPVDCKEYEESAKHTERQKIKFDKKDLKEGYSYIMKDGTEALYLGRHNFNDTYDYGGKTIDEFNPLGKNHIFLNLKKDKYQSPYLIQSGFAKIAECTSSAPLQQFPNEYEKFKKSSYCGDIKELIIEKLEINHPNDLNGFLLLKEDGKYYAAKIQRYYNYNYSSRNEQQYELLRSIDEFIPDLNNKIKNLKVSHYGYFSSLKLAKQDLYSLIAVTENGKKLRVIK